MSHGADTVGEWRERAVPIETVEAARAVARKAPWTYAWRALPDGSLEVAHVTGRRNVLHRFRPGDAKPELLAESARQSTLSFVLTHAWIPAFVSFMLVFVVSVWFLLVIAVCIGVIILGARLDKQPSLRPWLRERFGSDGDWATMPRVVGDLPATGNQLVALCALADSHGDEVTYRPLAHGTVEVALKQKGGYEIHWLNRDGKLKRARTVELRRPTRRKLRKAEGNDPEWQELKTDEPPSD